MQTVLVLDGHLKSALCAVRTLGRQGIPVYGGAVRTSALALHSRYVKGRFIYPDPVRDQVAFVAALTDYAKAHHHKTGEKIVLYCFSEATQQSVQGASDSLAPFLHLLIPSAEAAAVAADKRRTAELAKQWGVPTIPTYDIAERDHLTYPVVLKPARSVVWQEAVGMVGTSEMVWSAAMLEERYATLMSATNESPLIQARITGEEYGIEFLMQRGEVLREFAHRRLVSLSPRGGAAVVKETAPSTDAVEVMRQHAKTLLRALYWTGPVMVEFKYDRKTNTVRLMEINGRFWGSLPLAQFAGVDFVTRYYQLAIGASVSPDLQTELPYARSSHFLGHVKWLLSVLFARDALRAELYPTRLHALGSFLRERFRGRSDVWSLQDPSPTLWEIIDILKR